MRAILRSMTFLPPDNHVHSQFSWDALAGSMEATCERAVEIGLSALAFTEHADFVTLHKGQHSVDIVGYLDEIERCRAKFKGVRILSGVELGEPHWFPKETAAVLGADRVREHVAGVYFQQPEWPLPIVVRRKRVNPVGTEEIACPLGFRRVDLMMPDDAVMDEE